MIITVLNHRFGSGKTTASMNLASALCYGSPENVLLIDLDPQSTCSTWFGIKNSEYNIYKSMNSKEEIKMNSIHGNLKFIPSNLDLSKLEMEFPVVEGKETLLKDLILKNNFQNQFNYIIIDCPSNLGILTLNALVASQEIIIPISVHSNYTQIINTTKLYTQNIKSKYNPKLELPFHLVNFYDKNSKSDETALEAIKKEKSFKTNLHKSDEYSNAHSKNKAALEAFPDGVAAGDFFKLAKEIRGI